MAIIEELLKAKTELDNLKLKLSQTQQVQLPLEQAARTNLRLRLTQSKTSQNLRTHPPKI